MRQDADLLTLSATDLSNFLNCRHRTALDMAAARGRRRSRHGKIPLLEALIKRGHEHEADYVASLRNAGRTIVDLNGPTSRDAAIEATERSDSLRCRRHRPGRARHDGRSYGRPDVLQRVDSPSPLGPWSYEIADTKLARETRAGTIVQLGLYCECSPDLAGHSGPNTSTSSRLTATIPITSIA